MLTYLVPQGGSVDGTPKTKSHIEGVRSSGPTSGPTRAPTRAPTTAPTRVDMACFQPFKNSPQKLPRTIPRRRPWKCPRKCPLKWSRLTCPVFTCSISQPNPLHRKCERFTVQPLTSTLVTNSRAICQKLQLLLPQIPYRRAIRPTT